MAETWQAETLAQKYKDFVNPCAEIWIGGKKVTCAEEQSMEEVRILSSTGNDPDMAVITYRVGKEGKQTVGSLEAFFSVGAKTEIKVGYAGSVSRVFLGYLHEVEASSREGEDVNYTLVCLDVKGLMKKNTCFGISAEKTYGQLLTEFVNTSAYSSLIESKSIDELPECFDGGSLIKGETHYDWICSLAEYLDYEFYCSRGKLCFHKAQKDTSVMLKLSGDYGLRQVQSVATLQGQTGSVWVYGYNRKDQKIMASDTRGTAPGPFADKLDSAVSGCRKILWDMELETGEQASERAKAVMGRSFRKCSRMEVVNIGIPELVPGRCVQVKKADVTSLEGKLYVEETEHILDRNGYQIILRGSRISDKGA